MIVFTATSQVNHQVFVGSCRTDLEEHWITLVNQAEDGVEGPFYASIRTDGPDSFDLEEYGFAEDASEMRELVREAQADLGAQQIKAARQGSVIKKPVKVEKIDLKELENSASEWDDEPVSDWLDDRRQEASKPSEQEEKPQAQASVSSLDMIKAALQNAAQELKPTRAGQPASSKTPAKSSVKSKKSSSDAEAKLASGRTGSATKEKRIKEAITAEREERLMQRQTQSTQEAAQMKEVLLSIESRRLANKQKAKETREKAAKLQRAEQRASERARKESESAVRTQAAAEPRKTLSVSKKISSKAAVSRADIKAEAARLVAQTRAEQAELDKAKEKPSAEDARALARAHAQALRANKSQNQSERASETVVQVKPDVSVTDTVTGDMAAMLARLNERAATAERGRRRR